MFEERNDYLTIPYRVDVNLMIKVGDFGLSRDMYQTDYYKMSDTSVCPIKWMPPEMIRDGISSEKSDVVRCHGAFNISSNIVSPFHVLLSLSHSKEPLK